MDYERERRFVQAFIRKDRRERLLFELTTPKKRRDGVDRFCHQAKELLDPAGILMEGEDLDRRPAFWRFMEGHDEIVLMLSPDFYADEWLLPLKDAVAQAALSLDAVLIMGSGFALVFGEPVKGGRGKFLLSEERTERGEGEK